MKILNLLNLIGFMVLLPGCVYHFTNERVVRPDGIRTIAVEAVYDTSREVIPHEMLWEALQMAIAADGHLQLVSQRSADALMRAHIKSASISAGGREQLNGPPRDPGVFNRDIPAIIGDYPQMSQSSRYKDSGAVNMTVEIEVYNLSTRALLLKQTYSLGEAFRAVHQTRSGEFTTAANDYIRYEEAAMAKVKSIANTIARSVVRDLLVR